MTLALPPVLRAASLLLATLLSTACATQKTAGMAYVSNQDGDVTVIDLETMETTGNIATGSGAPRGIGISADGRLLVTANREGGNVSIIERASGKLLHQVPIGENPEFVRVRGTHAFVSFEPESDGGPPPKPGSPEALALEKQRAEDEDTEPAQIAVVDLELGKVVRNIVGGVETEGIEFSADGKNILITNEADQSISVHEIESGTRLKTIDTSKYGTRPRGIKQAPDGKSYLATLEYGNKVLVLDANYDPVNTFDTGAVPYGIAFDAEGERLFVALSRGKALQVFDAKTYAPIKEIPTGDRCWHFSFTPDNRQILVACGRSHEVVVIDAAKLEVTKRIAGKALPWGIVTWPKSVGSLDAP